MLPQQCPQGPSFTPTRLCQDLHPFLDFGSWSSTCLLSLTKVKVPGQQGQERAWLTATGAYLSLSTYWSLGPSGKAGDMKRGGHICGGFWESGRLWDFLER